MKTLNRAKQNLSFILFSALTGVCLLLPRLSLADDATNCSNFQKQFKGVFDWVNLKNYCTASGLAIFVIQTLINFSGVVAVMFLIIGGFFYLTSAGNEEQSEKGKKIMINSIIGLVVIILAYAIVSIIGSVLTSGQ